jgi:hypothetical protein
MPEKKRSVWRFELTSEARGVKTILSFGMGVESSALLLRWIEEPQSRDFDLEQDLIVITAQTGDEWPDTKMLIEQHLLPRMRAQRIRYVQLARAGHLEADGIVVLADTREPRTVYLEGAYKLSQELRAAGTVPQYAGERRCSLKFKAWVIETWLAQEMHAESYRHAIGYNADEGSRITKSEAAFIGRDQAGVRVAFGFNCDEEGRMAKARRYDSPQRVGWYPLSKAAWNWTRQNCQDYLKQVTGSVWQKSACVACPFCARTEDALERMRHFPEQVADALLLEHQSLCLNPRGTLYRDQTLLSVVTQAGNVAALRLFTERLAGSEHAIYRVRRIYKKKGKADRAVEPLYFGARAAVLAQLQSLINSQHLTSREQHDITYAYLREQEPQKYPTCEEFYVAAPAQVASKTRYGFEWFEARWRAALGRDCQGELFA